MDNNNVTIYKTYEDGFIVRSMTPEDGRLAQAWFGEICPTSSDLEMALDVFPPGSKGFYIGEYQGEVVASAIRIPVAPGVYYGSFYYVVEKCRKLGFGRRLRDDVAATHVGDNILAIDAHDNLLEMNKRHGYVESFRVSRFAGRVPKSFKTTGTCSVKKFEKAHLDALISYDNKCFVRPGSNVRKSLLERWTSVPGGTTLMACNNDGQVVGYGCRRPAFQQGNHLIGPLYADSKDIAYDLVAALCENITDTRITLDVCLPNAGALDLTKELDLKEDLEMIRMHKNGDPKELNLKVFGLTSIDVCGF